MCAPLATFQALSSRMSGFSRAPCAASAAAMACVWNGGFVAIQPFWPFGIQYPSTPHPRCAWVHTDGYLVVIAPTEADARLAAIDLCGTAWSGLYPAGATDWREAQQYWPMGELARLDSDGVLTVGAR